MARRTHGPAMAVLIPASSWALDFILVTPVGARITLTDGGAPLSSFETLLPSGCYLAGTIIFFLWVIVMALRRVAVAIPGRPGNWNGHRRDASPRRRLAWKPQPEAALPIAGRWPRSTHRWAGGDSRGAAPDRPAAASGAGEVLAPPGRRCSRHWRRSGTSVAAAHDPAHGMLMAVAGTRCYLADPLPACCGAAAAARLRAGLAADRRHPLPRRLERLTHGAGGRR